MKKTLLKFIIFFLFVFSVNVINAEEGLDIDMILLKLNKELKILNNEILSLKGENEVLKESQKINSEKIVELFEIIKIRTSKKEKTVLAVKTDSEKSALKLFSSGKENFASGDYEKATVLFKNYLNKFPSSPNIEDAKLWLGRSYFASSSYLESKKAYEDFHKNGNQDHKKYVDSLYELSRALIELGEINNAKLLLSKIIEEYPLHNLTSKASQLFKNH